jgi:hypothetical protein
MDTIMAWFGITLALLVVCWICYSHLTSSIIKDQQREIARLKRDKKRLESAVRASREVKSIEVYTEPSRQPQKANLRIIRHTDGKDELFGEW